MSANPRGLKRALAHYLPPASCRGLVARAIQTACGRCWLLRPAVMVADSPEALLKRLEQGHWFLKHRAKGHKPHKRFVYSDGPAIYWAGREDRTGKVGCLKAAGELLVVPGLASAVLFGKVRLRDRQNRLFSVVSSARSLDLEVSTEAERHLWVKVFNAFAQQHSPERASRSSQREPGEPHLASGASTPTTSRTAPPRDDGTGAALQAQLYGYRLEHIRLQPESHAAASWITCGYSLGCMRLQAQLRRVDTAQIMHGVRFPKLRGSLHVCQGDLARSWAVWRHAQSAPLAGPQLAPLRLLRARLAALGG